MTTLKEQLVTWNELSEQEQNLVAASYGQVHIGDLVYESQIHDDRFFSGDNNALPWDATATILDRNGLKLLHLEGWQGESGHGNIWGIILPRDVKISITVWDHNPPGPKPEKPEILEHYEVLEENVTVIAEKYRQTSGAWSQGRMMDYEHAMVLRDLGVYLRDEIYPEHDHQSCIDAMVTLEWVTYLMKIDKLSELMAEWSI